MQVPKLHAFWCHILDTAMYYVFYEYAFTYIPHMYVYNIYIHMYSYMYVYIDIYLKKTPIIIVTIYNYISAPCWRTRGSMAQVLHHRDPGRAGAFPVLAESEQHAPCFAKCLVASAHNRGAGYLVIRIPNQGPILGDLRIYLGLKDYTNHTLWGYRPRELRFGLWLAECICEVGSSCSRMGTLWKIGSQTLIYCPEFPV